MAATLNLYTFWQDPEEPDLKGGSLTVPDAITLSSGQPHYAKHTIADGYGKDVIWAAGEGGKDTFKFMIIKADKDIWVERKDDQGSPEFILDFIEANIPFMIPGELIGTSTTSTFDGAVLVDNTDYNNVVQVEAMRNEADGQGDAVVKLYLWD